MIKFRTEDGGVYVLKDSENTKLVEIFKVVECENGLSTFLHGEPVNNLHSAGDSLVRLDQVIEFWEED